MMALSIVCRKMAVDECIPSADIETMTFGEAVRRLKAIVEANVANLAMSKKGLRSEVSHPHSTVRALRERINQSYNAVAYVLGMPRLLLAPTWGQAKEALDRIGSLAWKVRDNEVTGVHKLLSLGADPNAKGVGGQTLLMHAAAVNRTQVIESLLAAHADVMARDTTGWVALHFGASNGHVEVVRILLNAKSGVFTHNDAGNRALYYATQFRHQPVIKLLTEAEAAHVE
jgi:hypothetical protein